MTSRLLRQIDTERLVLRPADADNLEALHRHWNQPPVRRYLWDDNPVPHETVAAALAQSQQHFEQFGYGLWTLHIGGREPLDGFCGLRVVADTSLVEVLYSLEPEAWDQGFATEAAYAVLRFAFDTLGLQEVVGGVDDDNAASIRVLAKLGMRPRDPIVLQGRPVRYLTVDRSTLRQP